MLIGHSYVLINSICSSYSSIFYWIVCLQFSSVAQSCLTLCDPMDCSTPGFPVHCKLWESTQTHVHWVGDAIQPSHPLSPPSPPAFSLSQHQGLFQCQLFTSGGQSIGVSASALVLPMNIQDWFPLGCTGWISLQSCLPYYLLQFFIYFACSPFIMSKCCKYLLPVCVFFFFCFLTMVLKEQNFF